jgi:exo-beta-1,3-glucanase (GH17 family)
VGVNYGTLGNNLPSPAQVAQLLLSTSLRNVKIYNADKGIMQAFANTNMKLVVGVGSESIPLLASSAAAAQAWVQTNIAAYMPATQVTHLAVGNEVFTTAPGMASQLVPAMVNIHAALVDLKLDGQVKVGTPHNLQVLGKSFPPSSGAFRANITNEVKALLAFLSSTGSPIMVNFYPYFAYRDEPRNVSLNYALFQPDKGVTDVNTGLHYSNMLDAQLDAVYSAMERFGYHSIPILVSETGWPSSGDPAEIAVSAANAQLYNQNLIKYVTSSKGTPLRPDTSVDAYIFALFNENMKPGPGSERFFGLFNPDKSLVYNLGIVTTTSPPAGLDAPPPFTSPVTPAPPVVVYPPPSMPVYPPPLPTLSPPAVTLPPPATIYPPPTPVPSPVPPTPYANPTPVQGGNPGKTWCVAKPGSPDKDVTNALDFACGEGGADCGAIQAGGACFNPNTIISHASFAYNTYYQKMGRNYWNCYFGGTGVITITDPSKWMI